MRRRAHATANTFHVAVHPVAHDVLEEPAFRAAQVDAMRSVEHIGAVVDSKVMIDAVFLNVGIASLSVHGRILKVRRGRAVAAKRPAVSSETPLQLAQVCLVEDEALKV